MQCSGQSTAFRKPVEQETESLQRRDRYIRFNERRQPFPGQGRDKIADDLGCAGR